MTSNDVLRMQPAEVADATLQLDQLAGRAEQLMRTETSNLTVSAPARDEVSQRVASTLNDVHTDFRNVTDSGAAEIQDIAATLRAHTSKIVEAEQDFMA